MAISDTGGFDLSFEVTEELLTAAFLGGTAVAPPPAREVTLTDLKVRIEVTAITPTSLDVLPGEAVFLRGTFTGSVTVLSASIAGAPITIPAGLAAAALGGTFAVRATVTLGVLSGVRGVVLTPAPQGSSVVVDENAFFASPPIQLLLAAEYIRAGGGMSGETAYQQRRAALSGFLQGEATAAAVAAIGATPQTLVVAEPAGLVFGAVRTSGVSLKVLASSLLPPGNPMLATGTALRRNALGAALDHVALVADNGSVLSSVRVGLSGVLGISPGFGPWFASHPSVVLVSTPIAPPAFPIPSLPAVPGNPPAGAPFLDFAHAFVNAAGMLQIDLRVRAVMWSSLATVTTTATLTAPFVATVVGGRLTFGVGPPTLATTSNVDINPLLYVAAIFLGGPVVAAVLAAIDVFAGPFVDGAIAGPLAGTLATLGVGITVPLSGPFTALTPLLVTGVEPAAPMRFVTLPGPVPITIPIDQAQDVTARFA